MQRRVFVSRAAITAGVAMMAGPGGAQAQQVAWEDVTGPDGRYRLRIPKGYRYLQVASHGGILHSYVSILPGGFILELMEVAFPSPQPTVPTTAAGLEQALEQMQGGLQKSWPGSTVIEQRPIQNGAVMGRQATFAINQGSSVVVTRLYLTPMVGCTQIAQGPAAERGNPVLMQFLESLRLA